MVPVQRRSKWLVVLQQGFDPLPFNDHVLTADRLLLVLLARQTVWRPEHALHFLSNKMMICSSASQALQPLQLQKRIQRPTCFRSCTSSSRRRLIHPVSQRIGLQSVLVVRADTGREGPLAEPEEPHSAHEGLSDSAKQLLSVTALAFFTVSESWSTGLGPTNSWLLQQHACIGCLESIN
jgi:hypothetical protein